MIIDLRHEDDALLVEEEVSLLFMGRPGLRPTLLSLKGGETARSYIIGNTYDLEAVRFDEDPDEPRRTLGFFVWEGTFMELPWPGDESAGRGIDLEWQGDWRQATRADLERFGFPLPE